MGLVDGRSGHHTLAYILPFGLLTLAFCEPVLPSIGSTVAGGRCCLRERSSASAARRNAAIIVVRCQIDIKCRCPPWSRYFVHTAGQTLKGAEKPGGLIE